MYILVHYYNVTCHLSRLYSVHVQVHSHVQPYVPKYIVTALACRRPSTPLFPRAPWQTLAGGAARGRDLCKRIHLIIGHRSATMRPAHTRLCRHSEKKKKEGRPTHANYSLAVMASAHHLRGLVVCDLCVTCLLFSMGRKGRAGQGRASPRKALLDG